MFEKFLHQTPFLRFVIPFVAGIILKIKLQLPEIHSSNILCGLLIIILFSQILHLNSNYTFNKVWGTFVALYLFVLGIQLIEIKQAQERLYSNSAQLFIATLIEQPEEKEKVVKSNIKLNLIKDTSTWISENSKILCYFEKDSNALKLKLGDQIITKAHLNSIKHTGNPFAFNYKKYLKYQEIYTQCYIESNQFKIIASNQGSQLRLLSHKIRQHLLSMYTKNGIQKDEFAVLSALTLGYKSELTPELKESFSTSGAMHILAVSGLHVGIIYIILCKLLFFLHRFQFGRYFQSIIVIFTLFFYALLTGLSDSVLRATIMFTFISIGKMFKRQLNIYNSIAASAFFLLIINPYSIMNVGFQLSYTAVLSIVFFQPKIYSLIKINQPIVDYVWQLISVSIAAQIGTFPITLLYFGQFPLYFIFTNILIIPIATLIIYGAFLLFILSFSDFVAQIISSGLTYITQFLNSSISFIEDLPYAKINAFHLDGTESLLLLILVLICSFFIITKRINYLKLSITLSIIIASYNIYNGYIKHDKTLFVVHHLKDKSGIHFIDKNHACLYTSKKLSSQDIDIKYNVSPLWNNLEIPTKNITTKSLNNSINYLKLNKKHFIQLNSYELGSFECKNRLTTDYLILSNNVNTSISELKKFFNFDLIIFDSSNDYYHIRAWVKECTENNIPFYNVLEEGAYIAHL